MEENLFPRPAVRRALAEKYVQCWLHTDHPTLGDANKQLQRSYVGSLTIPVLVIVDPQTRNEIRRHDWPMDEPEILAFLLGQ